MARELSSIIQSQINKKTVKPQHIFKINNVDFSSYLLPQTSISANKEFGANSAVFVLNNNDGRFNLGGNNAVSVGDLIEYSEKYQGDSIEWNRFYGLVVQRSRGKSANTITITLNCLDYISIFQDWELELKVEGTKTEITNEILTPNYLPEPNENLAQLFDFVNNNLADDPPPIILIRDVLHTTDDLQNDGFEVYYANGQLKLGSPINARYNYEVIAKSYWMYTKGVYVEDVLEQIITAENGYGGFIFGEESAQDVIDNHLTTNYYAEVGSNTDVMIPNYTPSTITIEHQLVSNVSAGNTSIHLDSVEGLPESGEGSINGDVFTWSSKSGNTLTGIPSSGSYSLKSHKSGSYVKYENTYSAGQVWYLSYSNLITTLTQSDFTLPEGITINYLDKRFGRIILDEEISPSSTVTCNTNYSFKTLQATGIEINSITFTSEELDNRLEAINKLREFIEPNYIIRTMGDNKIWASYLTQKINADYTLKLIQESTHLEDEDLYTRTKFFAKNKNPTNIMFKDGVDFVTTGESYKSLASQTTLKYDGEEGNYWIYKCLISNAGYIDLEQIKPVVYINNVAIDDRLHRMVALPVSIEVTTRMESKTGCHGISKENYVKVHTYYYYKVKFPHQSIEPSQPIYLYDSTGGLQVTLSPYDLNMDYARGIWNVPGENQNSVIESLSTGTYWVFYSTGELVIDYDNVIFKINKRLIPNTNQALVTATFEYWSVMTAVQGIASVIDGRWDTQVQTEFFAEPPTGYNYAIVDLGQIYSIQAIDIVAGFFKPDEIRKFDIDFSFSLEYSLDGSNFYNISSDTQNVRIGGGEKVSFEREQLGISFNARYLKIVLEEVKQIDYRNGVWVVAFSEICAYGDIVLVSETKLIPTTTLTQDAETGDLIVYVNSTEGFATPESGESEIAYIGENSFTYTGLTSNTFTGCIIESGISELVGTRVSQELESDTVLYDDSGLLPKLGDRLYKEIRISDTTLYTQEELNRVSRAFLREFIKNHSKLRADTVFAPYLCVGQTVYLENDELNYFIESINEDSYYYSLVLARYP